MMDSVPGSLAAAPMPMIDAAGDEPVDVGRQRGDDGPGAEDRDAGEHDALATEDVAEHPGRQHEAGEGQRVAVDHPLQRGDARVEIALDVRQPDADDRVVEKGEEEDRAQRRQRDRLGRRTEPPLLDLEPGGAPGDASAPLAAGQHGRARSRSGSGLLGLAVALTGVLPTRCSGRGTPRGAARRGAPRAPECGTPRTDSVCSVRGVEGRRGVRCGATGARFGGRPHGLPRSRRLPALRGHGPVTRRAR